ncbi:MAG: SUMF1/EgtB/PvdO family nonheme iron enzyme [Kofleriaceae bacterium]
MKRLLLVALASLAACNLNPYDLSRGGSGTGDGGMGDGGGSGTGDGGGSGSNDGGPTCIPIGVDDQCNEVDDDCDGVVDQAFDKQTNTNHCGTCNNRCIGAGAIQACTAGTCTFVECQVGFADLDADPLTCDYQCPLFPPRAEDCNGVDDDCDGVIDETLPNPPTGQCRVTPNTPCAGTTMICETRGTQTRWWCDYSADVEFDPTIPNGIVLAEQLCDGLDGDCDGIDDDTFTDLGQECDNGAFGICRDVGERICDPNMPSQTMCDLSVLPDAQAMATETCDGLDNNCDNEIDNATGPNRVIDAMTHVNFGGNNFYIDTYEASRPDSTATAIGVSSARSCSKAGVMPWTGATFASAQAACASAGKVLCSASRWQAACEGSANTTFPYGTTFGSASCNTETYDATPGGADQDMLIATGMLPTCATPLGIQDMSGNLKEWTDEITGQTAGGIDIAVQRGGSYESPSTAATCDFRLTRAAVNSIEPETGFRCCRATAP